jgi:hypothetical protein
MCWWENGSYSPAFSLHKTTMRLKIQKIREAFMGSEVDENWYHLKSMKSKYDTRL